MLIIGLVLLLLGIFLSIPVLYTIGIILLVVGAVFWILGSVGRPIGGRKYWSCPPRRGRAPAEGWAPFLCPRTARTVAGRGPVAPAAPAPTNPSQAHGPARRHRTLSGGSGL